MASNILSAALILLTLILSVKHGLGMLRSTPEETALAEELKLSRPGQLTLAWLVLVAGVLILFPATFFVGNLLGATIILIVTILQLRVRNLKGALVEIPFLLLPFLMIYLRHPLRR
jgi:predicted membrane-bound spermidine synthase